MARYISLSVLLIICMLALISRKNYSKYKDGISPIWWLSWNIKNHIDKRTGVRARIKKLICRITPLNKVALEKETDRWIAGYIHSLLMVLIMFMVLVFGLSWVPESEDDSLKVERPEAGENSEYIEFNLVDETTNKSETYSLEVKPREYTEAEFHEVANEVKEYLDLVILADNPGFDEVTTDMFFPKKYKTSGIKIVWESDNPTVLSDEGHISEDMVEESVEINLTATIKDNNYSDEYIKKVVVNKNITGDSTDEAKVAMLNIENGNRAEDGFVIPEKIGDIRVNRIVETNEMRLVYLLILGVILIILFGYYRYYKVKEKAGQRDEEIRDAYYGFVNRLTIYLGAGFTLQRSIMAAVKNEKCIYLVKEVEYTTNMISSGVPELQAYKDLGDRLGSEEYLKLMSLISQNLSYGYSGLIKLLDSEVKNSFFLRKERIRKKGEQASEKLLLPTSILMILVIVVVMYPAIIGMK